MYKSGHSMAPSFRCWFSYLNKYCAVETTLASAKNVYCLLTVQQLPFNHNVNTKI